MMTSEARSPVRISPTGYLSLLLPPVLFVVLLSIGAIQGYRGESMTVYVLGALTLSLGLIPIAANNAMAGGGRGHVVIAFLSLVYSLHFAIPALVRYAPARGPEMPASMGDQIVLPTDVSSAQVIVLYGLLALLIGYANPLLNRSTALVPEPVWDWKPGPLMGVALAMLAVGWFLTIVLSLGTSAFGTGFIGTLASAQRFALILLALAWYRDGSRNALLIIAVVVPFATIFGLLTGSKREAVNAAALLVMTLMILRRRVQWRWVAIGVLALALLYPLNHYLQDYLLGGARASAVEVLSDPSRVASSLSRFVSDIDVGDHLEAGLDSVALRLDGLGVVSVIVRDTPGLVPYQNGRTIALFFIAPIPRALWPGKPVFTVGQWVTDSYSHGLDTRTAPTQVGEFYFNFGTAGVILGMLFLGTVIRILNNSFVGPRATAPSIMVVIVAIYYLCVTFESAIAKVYANIMFAAVPLLLVHFVLRQMGACYIRSDDEPGERPPEPNAFPDPGEPLPPTGPSFLPPVAASTDENELPR